MLTYFLIICTSVNGGVQCLPAQPMPSKKACLFAGNVYVRLGARTYQGGVGTDWRPVSFDCMGLTK
jgi:hypothetical protein